MMTNVENGLMIAKISVGIGLTCFAVYKLGPPLIAFFDLVSRV
ncbi:hypothetical protein OVY29_21915 [Sphingopyxis sp. SE2]|nr:hypothetical protein [Sphingopyxis sp. SE2]MDT7531318.1 hypothetical protein [Sphingopyxis sp. SE2]